MKILSFVGAPLLAATLVACSSAPVNYYTLQLPPTEEHIAQGPSAPFDIDVSPVGIPVQLDQQPLVVRGTDNRIAIRDSERWASPYDEEIRSALAANLARQLNTMDVTGLPRPKDKAILRVKVEIRQFDVWPGKQVILDANWSLAFVDAPQRGTLICHGRLNAPAPEGYPQIVGAQQQVLNALSARVADDARHWASSNLAGCTDATPSASPAAS